MITTEEPPAESIAAIIRRKILGHGSGWAFTAKDFAAMGPAGAIRVALHRLERTGEVRRVIRGVYDRPRYSPLLGVTLHPDPHAVAMALARHFRWRVQPSGPAALNATGLSTQVPARLSYSSTGPTRGYLVGETTIEFKHAATKEAGFSCIESGLVVQCLKSLGPRGITAGVLAHLRRWLPPRLRARVLRDTSRSTAWVAEAIRTICAEDAVSATTSSPNPGLAWG